MDKKSKLYKLISVSASLLFWILVWWAAALKAGSEFLLPSPISTAKALGALITNTDFLLIVLISLLRILSGILIAIALGSSVAIITAKLMVADSLLSPLMSVIKATPIASFIILALLWIDRNTLPIFITVLIVLPIVWSNVSAGIRAVDKNLLDVAKIYRFSLGKRITKIYVPSVVPYFLAACRASLGMAWKAGIAAEVLCTPTMAIGTQIYFSKTYFETPDLFAWTLTIIILSIIIEKLLMFSLTRLLGRLHVKRKEASDA